MPERIRKQECVAFVAHTFFYFSQIEIDIEQSDTIRRIKERVEEKQGIQPDQQRYVCIFLSVSLARVTLTFFHRLIFGGKPM